MFESISKEEPRRNLTSNKHHDFTVTALSSLTKMAEFGYNNSSEHVLDYDLPHNSIGIFWCSFLALEALLITILNLLTIGTFVINSHLRKRSSCCIVNLAVADLLIGVVAIPMNVLLLGLVFSFWGDLSYFLLLFYFQTTIHVFTGMASLFSLVLISLERVLATVCPLQHRTTSNFTYVFGVSTTWVLAAVVAAVWICTFLYSNTEVSLYLWMPSLLFSLLVISSAYVGVYVAVKLHNTKQQNALKNFSFKREKELAMTLFIVAAISLLSWVPFAVVQVINFRNNISLSLSTIYTSIAVAYANSFVNPIVYVFRMQAFRSALVQLITKCSRDRFRRKSSSNSHSVTDGLISRKKITRASLINASTDV